MSETKTNKRIKYIDYVRALCMIWIVGVWHLQQYANYDIVNHITEDITSGVLGAFIFISGYFLGKKSINSLSELGDFYKRRFLRIYPMFFLSCISLYLLYVLFNTDSITSVKELILTLTGLACIIPPIPSTIWFVCMILLFYAITPLIISRKRVASKIAVCVAIYAVLISIKLIFKDTDHRLLLWFPMYSLGLLLANVKFKDCLLDNSIWESCALVLTSFNNCSVNEGVFKT